MPQIEGVDVGVRIGTFEPYRSVDQFGMVAFPRLESLNISGLDNVEKIWHNQLLEDSFSQLKEIRVASCGKLLNIFPSSMLNMLQSLQFLRAVDCSSLEVVHDMEWINVKEAVTTTLLIRDLVQLQDLRVSSCGVEELVVKEDGVETAPRFVFPIMTSLRLMNLQQFKSFYPGTHTIMAFVEKAGGA
ncbi:hypothetical protein CK203_042922 [Vitis vinifera]|uniref:Disease resistance protein At4g27190-like leucine-rich repeats domain-containing protein n=1 Tax=Vitis vinifera TaxID=29760 RepID=A0A438HUQ9_VITVI|nr:hypothetical protein CK203_042922 [Vitis vinifera]